MSEHDEYELLEQAASRFRIGDQIFTPAHRWETVEATERDKFDLYVQVTTRTGRKVCRWRFESWKKYPVMPASYATREPKVRLWDGGRYLKQVIAAVWDWEYSVHKGYRLAEAHGKTGAGWKVYDNGADDPARPVAEGVSKAQAVSLVKRIARERAKELGVAVDFGGAK